MYTACAFLSNLMILVRGLQPSVGTHGPRSIKKNKINILIASIDTALLCCFPEKGKMVLSGRWYEITWYDSQLRGSRCPDIGWTVVKLHPGLNKRGLLSFLQTCFRTCSAFLGVEHPSHPVIFRKKLWYINYLQDINQTHPGTLLAGFWFSLPLLWVIG